MAVARWTLLNRSPVLARSSHCLSATSTGRAALFSGELKPRTPVDAEPNQKGVVHVFDVGEAHLQAGGKGTWKAVSASSTSSLPEPRVGATTTVIGDDLYLWGGRGGKDMAPISGEQTGLWRTSLLDTNTIKWEKVVATNESDAPQPTSFHTMQSHANKIYVHAGCPATGRVSDLYAFDTSTNSWSKLSTGPEPGRGGTVLAVTHISQGDVFLRFAGFAGFELGADNVLDIYDIRTDSWRSLVPLADKKHGYPGPRSVHGFVGFTSPKYPSAVALMYHGERDPSKLGHAGAGSFWNDVWLLHETSEEPGLQWQFVPVEGEGPEERGWFPSASFVDQGTATTKVLMQGGLLSSNARSDEFWQLEID